MMAVPVLPANTHWTAAKAIVGSLIAAAVAGLGVVFTGLDDGVISQQEIIGAIIATLGALAATFGGVYVTSNKLVHDRP